MSDLVLLTAGYSHSLNRHTPSEGSKELGTEPRHGFQLHGIPSCWRTEECEDPDGPNVIFDPCRQGHSFKDKTYPNAYVTILGTACKKIRQKRRDRKFVDSAFVFLDSCFCKMDTWDE